MADCGLPFPVVCIQCGRGVGLCGIKVIGESQLRTLTLVPDSPGYVGSPSAIR